GESPLTSAGGVNNGGTIRNPEATRRCPPSPRTAVGSTLPRSCCGSLGYPRPSQCESSAVARNVLGVGVKGKTSTLTAQVQIESGGDGLMDVLVGKAILGCALRLWLE